MVTSGVRSRERRWFVAGVAAIIGIGLSAPPASARPHVADTFRHRPAAVAVGVDAAGRVYTVANDGVDRDSTALIRAFDPDGTLRWERMWRPPLASVSGRDIAVTPDGTVAVTAKIASTDPDVPCDEIWSYGWAVKTWTSDGTPLWQHAEHGWRTCDVFGTAGRAVAIGSDVVVVGIQHADEYSASVDLVAFGRSGERRWLRRLRTPGADDEILAELELGPRGAVYAAVTTFTPGLDVEHEADAVLVKQQPDGSPAWMRRAPGRPGADERGASVVALAAGVVFGALMDAPAGVGAVRVAAYGWGGGLRWRWRATGVSRTTWRWWLGPWVAVWNGGVLLAGTEDTRSGHPRATLRGYDREGHLRWRIRLGPSDVSRGAHALAARGDVIVLAGGRYDAPDLANRVWILTG